jgi:hypothetical protein
VSSSTPRKHHTVSAGYVRRFVGDANTVTVHHAQRGIYDEGPGGVGYQVDYWGTSALASRVEARFSRVESDALGLLAHLEDRWPLDERDRAALGQFIASHIVRLPSFGGALRQFCVIAAREMLAEKAPEHGLDEQQVAVVAEHLRSQLFHARDLLRQIPRIASALCSMHWTVVEFENDWLISCDQPVVLLARGQRDISPASAIQPYGLMNTFEGRFTLDPHHALLLTWHHEPDGAWLRGARAHACSINCALKAQTLQEWFCRPGTAPPLLSPPILEERVFPIAPDLLPGYTMESASASGRRHAAEALISKIIEGEPLANEVRWTRVNDPTAAAASATDA